jgi:hypothetical protein
MDSHGIKMKGDFETNNIRSQDGTLAIEIENTTGKTTIKQDFQFESSSPSAGAVLVSTDVNGNAAWGSSAIPPGEIILFESNTSVLGFTLLTDVDDDLVYITRGSAAGGETGGTSKSGSTWTQPNHTHTITSQSGHTHTTSDHTLTIDEMPSHTHTDNGRALGDADGSPNGHSWDGSHDTGSTGGDQPHNHGDTGSDGSHDHGGTTNGSATANTWRPAGRNFTRQQKN